MNKDSKEVHGFQARDTKHINRKLPVFTGKLVSIFTLWRTELNGKIY